MWVGFLYTLVLKLPSEHGVTKVSKKGHGPIFSAIFHSELDLLIYGVDMVDETFWVFLMMTKVSSTNLLHKLGGVGDVLIAFS